MFSKKNKDSIAKLNKKLMKAVINGEIEQVKKLLDSGAEINYIDPVVSNCSTEKKGCTALFHAIDKGHKDVAALLISQGADCKIRCYASTSSILSEHAEFAIYDPLEYAIIRRNKEIVQLLLNTKNYNSKLEYYIEFAKHNKIYKVIECIENELPEDTSKARMERMKLLQHNDSSATQSNSNNNEQSNNLAQIMRKLKENHDENHDRLQNFAKDGRITDRIINLEQTTKQQQERINQLEEQVTNLKQQIQTILQQVNISKESRIERPPSPKFFNT